MCICMCIYIYIYTYIHTYIYIYIEREIECQNVVAYYISYITRQTITHIYQELFTVSNSNQV